MKSTVRDVLETLILTVLIFLVVRSVVQNFKVEGRSMEPTLHNGQYLIINKAIYWRTDGRLVARLAPGAEASSGAAAPQDKYLFHSPERGDVIVFRYPKDPTRDFIKRVIAVPGDVVEIRTGTVYINGQPTKETYTADVPHYSYPAEKVPAGNYFVLGDNRNNSSDSHVWGLVPESYIIGKAWLSYWPTSTWGLVSDMSEALAP
jgi:signal peptidase I